MSLRRLALGALAVATAACSIDDRVLTNDDTVGAGGQTGTGGQTAGTGGSNAGGAMGVAGAPMLDGSSTNHAGGAGAGGAARDSGLADMSMAEVDSPLIDDAEDGNVFLLRYSGRRGSWVTFNDGSDTGTQFPRSGTVFIVSTPGHASNFALRTYGGGFQEWGAVMGAIFMTGNPAPLYDASKYKGITFWAKLVAGTLTAVRVQIPDRNTLPPNAAGVCTTGQSCNDHFGKYVTLTRDWAQYTVLFSEMKQTGWGVPQLPAITPSGLQSLQFNIDPHENFDLWVDDVAFVPN